MIEATSCGGSGNMQRQRYCSYIKVTRTNTMDGVLPKGTIEAGEEYKETAIRGA